MGVTTEQRDRLIEIERTIVVGTETAKAASYVPLGMQSFDTPIFVNRPKALRRRRANDTMFENVRTWAMELYASPAPTVVTPEETEEWLYDWIDATYAKFDGIVRLNLSGESLLEYVINAELTGDTGIVNRTYSTDAKDVSYYIVVFNLEVTYWSICNG